MQYSFAFHIVGILLWVGGLILLPRAMRGFTLAGVSAQQILPTAKKMYFGYVVSGAVVAAITGAYQILSVGVSFYMKQGWFHGKLTMIIVLLVMTLLLGAEIFSKELHPKKLLLIHAVSAASMLIIVFLTFIGRA